MADGNKVYIQLSKEIAELDKDLTRGLASVGYMAKANKGDLDRLIERVEKLEEELQAVRRREAANGVRLHTLEDAKKDHTGKFETISSQGFHVAVENKKARTESMKARLAFWGPIALLIIANVISLALHWAGISFGN